MAKFKVSKLFQINGRGWLVSGDIIDGEISGGDLIHLLTDGDSIKLEIKSVAYVDHLKGIAEIGLMIGQVDDDIEKRLKMMIGEAVLIVKDY